MNQKNQKIFDKRFIAIVGILGSIMLVVNGSVMYHDSQRISISTDEEERIQDEQIFLAAVSVAMIIIATVIIIVIIRMML